MVSKWIAGVAVAFSSAAAAQQVINPPPQLISPGQNTCFDPANSAVSFNWNGHPGQVLTAFNPSAGYDVDYNFSNGPLPSAWNADYILPYEEQVGNPSVVVDVPTPLLIPPYCAQSPVPPGCTTPALFWEGEASAFANPFDGTDTVLGKIGEGDPISLTPGAAASFIGAATSAWGVINTYQPVAFMDSPLWRYNTPTQLQMSGAFGQIIGDEYPPTTPGGPPQPAANDGFPKVAMDLTNGALRHNECRFERV